MSRIEAYTEIRWIKFIGGIAAGGQRHTIAEERDHQGHPGERGTFL